MKNIYLNNSTMKIKTKTILPATAFILLTGALLHIKHISEYQI